MYYSITVKLPKSKIQQYDMPGPVSVNDLSDAEFQSLILKLYLELCTLFFTATGYSLFKTSI